MSEEQTGPAREPAEPGGSGGSGGSGQEGESGQDDRAGPSGPELARAMLDAAHARRRGSRPLPRQEPAAPAYSGSRPDTRDPQPIGAVLSRLVADRGWRQPAAEAAVFGRWAELVGPEIADHCRPTKLERGELTIEAESTAWATQLRTLAPSLLSQLTTAVGRDVVSHLRIHGPATPSWKRGPRRIRGRGPRDTYG